VYQVLLNLISNANRFTPGGQIGVVVHGPGEVMPGFLDVEVTDAGPGIPVGDLERIFEPFEQSPAGEGDGSGLGLTVSREFARALGGDLLVRSMIGQGACFTLRLPVRVGDESADLDTE
jgi:signal transduction histidine kinase